MNFLCLLSFTIIANDQDVILVQFFEKLPILVEQATRNSHSSNINLLENFHRKLDNSLNNVVHIFLSRCEELMTIPNSPTINIRRLKVELHSINTRINIISAEYNYMTSAIYLFTISSVDPTYLMSYVYLLVSNKLLGI